MSNIAIITARGGSKRIPHKNIKEFCGKPIIAYSIDAAKKSGVFDEIMVSTDSEEIAAISKQYGASVPFFRSEVTSNDFATTDEVILEVVKAYEEMGKFFELICLLGIKTILFLYVPSSFFSISLIFIFCISTILFNNIFLHPLL